MKMVILLYCIIFAGTSRKLMRDTKVSFVLMNSPHDHFAVLDLAVDKLLGRHLSFLCFQFF